MINKVSIKPIGWLKRMMEDEVRRGVVQHVPALLPDLFGDDIFFHDRIGPHTKPKHLGTLENDDSWNVQFFWWNSETIGNYFDGLMRYGHYLDHPEIKKQAQVFVEHILSSQDTDGYIGIYTKDFRYRFNSENGELWAKTTVGRLLLSYGELTGDNRALNAVIRMTQNVMLAWPIHQSTPFKGTNSFAGVAHGLMFVDVLYHLYERTHDRMYLDYALFLYEDYNRHEVSEPDCLIKNLQDPSYRFKGHGVHTYEHLRVVALYDTFSGKDLHLYENYMKKLQLVLSPSGGPIGDEWIIQNIANSDHHGYEFCSIHELMASLLFVSKLGRDDQYDLAKKIFINANLGSRHQEFRTIAYLKSDNSYAMEGCFHRPQPHSPHKIQTRYKYSPTHQDAAVCCVPNSVRITPYFLDGVITIKDNHVSLNMLAPLEAQFVIKGKTYFLNVIQDTPYGNAKVETDLGDLLIRKHSVNNQNIEIKKDLVGNIYFEYSGIVFAYPIPSINHSVKSHLFGLKDSYVVPINQHIPLTYHGDLPHVVNRSSTPIIQVPLYQNDQKIESLLVPIGETNLRQVTFKLRRDDC